jgi:hypothetical protein
MTHLHNSDVLTFLRIHINNPKVRQHIKDQQEWIDDLNERGFNYKDFLDYLEKNIGGDASYTEEELRELLK